MMSAFSHPTEQFCRIAKQRGIIYRVGKREQVRFCDQSDFAKFADLIEAHRIVFLGYTERGYGYNSNWLKDWLTEDGIEFTNYDCLRGVRLTSMSAVMAVQLRLSCALDERYSYGSSTCYRVVVPE